MFDKVVYYVAFSDITKYYKKTLISNGLVGGVPLRELEKIEQPTLYV